MLNLLVILLGSAESRQYTVSGHSSGGFFAHQIQVIHSESITGVGVGAGGPFDSKDIYNDFSDICLNKIDPDQLLPILTQKAENLAASGQISDLSLLSTANIYIYSGKLDVLVCQPVVKYVERFYRYFITDQSRIITNFNINAQHAWIINGPGNPCWYLGSPGINDCKFDLSGAMLNHMYGNLKPKVPQIKSNLYPFDQSAYADIVAAGLSTTGYIYVPDYCMTNVCRVHFFFHGCTGSAEGRGDVVMYGIGMNEWAESNQMVIIYPQIHANDVNKEGCWDFLGYTGPDYITYSGLQVEAVHQMAQSPPVVNWN